MYDHATAADPHFLNIADEIKSRRGFFSQFDATILNELCQKHGFLKTAFAIHQCMLNEWLKAGRWGELLELVERYGIDKVTWAVRAMNKLENHSIATVEGLCNGTIAPVRKNPNGAANGGASETPRRKSDMALREELYPMGAVHTERSATTWLRKKELSAEHWPEYFDRAGNDELFGWRLYQLKPEYR